VSASPAEAGQPTPFARQTACPITVAVANVPERAYTEDPEAVPKPNHPVEVPFANESEERTAAEAWRFCAKRLVEVVFVPVAFVQTRFAKEDGAEPVRTRDVAVTDPNVAFVEERFANCPFVANRLVVVTEPPVAFVKVRPWSDVVPVAVNPPTRTDEKVPFEAWTEETNRLEPVAFVNVSDCRLAVPVAVRLPTVDARAYREFAKRFVVVTEVAVTEASAAFQRREAEPRERAASSVGMREVETPPKTARPVVVTLVAVPFVNETARKEEEPRTAKSPWTDTALENVNAPVDVPPLKTMALVVVFPELVTVWRLGEVPDGQFVPSTRQGSLPLT
jgi:hypothetical protein